MSLPKELTSEFLVDETIPDAWQHIWERRAAQLAQRPSQEDRGAQVELVLVELGCEVYGLDVHHVFDIKPMGRITSVPRVPEWVTGVVNLRGQIYSVVDLPRFLGLTQTAEDDENRATYLAVVKDANMEVALLVDNILTVEMFPIAQLQDVTDTVRGICSDYVRGVATHRFASPNSSDGAVAENERLLVVLDLPALLADERLVIHEEFG